MASRRAVIDRQAIVVAFDMCSSSNIIDDLTKSGNVGRLPVFFTAIERYLAARQIDAVPFHPYKFTGDGWVLLFPDRTDGAKLLRFLEGMCLSFAVEFRRSLLPSLSRKPALVGLTFGIERGELIPITLHGQQEYVGRSINVACRLQAALKDKGGSPAYSALMSESVYRACFAQTKPHRVNKVTRNLRNIDGGAQFACRRVWLLRPFEAADETG
jgi:class 3 adenylate cyclase